MKISDLVTFNHLPTPNTPGAPSCNPPGVGTVISERYPSGIMFQGDLWCDVLWPSGELTKCFKKDLVVMEENDHG